MGTAIASVRGVLDTAKNPRIAIFVNDHGLLLADMGRLLIPEHSPSDQEHSSRRSGAPPPDEEQDAPALQGRRRRTGPCERAQRVLVRRLQGRVHYGEQAVLLPPTVAAFGSRFLICCEALESTKE